MTLTTLFALSACFQGSLHLEDDVGPSKTLGRDALHLPYVRGAVVSVSAAGRASDDVDESWSLLADDEALFVPQPRDPDDVPDEDETWSWSFEAEAVGSTNLSLVQPDDEIVRTESVQVALPDEIRLSEATIERSDRPDLWQSGCTFQVVVDGIGGLVATYHRDDAPLYGNRVLSLSTEDPVELAVDHSFAGLDRDWPLVQPLAAGQWTVSMAVDGVFIDAFDFLAVPAEAITSVAFIGDDEDAARDGDHLELLVQSYDAQGCPVFGVEWTWTVDGVEQLETGDLFTYELDEDDETAVIVQWGDHRLETTVRGEGSVSSSQTATCSTLPGLAAAVSLWLALAGGLLVRLRRDD